LFRSLGGDETGADRTLRRRGAGYHERQPRESRNEANDHAAACWSMPKPTVWPTPTAAPRHSPQPGRGTTRRPRHAQPHPDPHPSRRPAPDRRIGQHRRRRRLPDARRHHLDRRPPGPAARHGHRRPGPGRAHRARGPDRPLAPRLLPHREPAGHHLRARHMAHRRRRPRPRPRPVHRHPRPARHPHRRRHRPLPHPPLTPGARHGSRPRRRATRRRRDPRGRHLRPHRVHARPAPPVRHREPADRRRPGQRLPALSLPPNHGDATVKTTARPAGRRLSQPVRLAWALVLGMLLAAAAWSLSGQLMDWGMKSWLAWPLSIMFDAAGLICATYARRAVERGTPAGLARLALLAFVTVAGVLNFNHGHTIGGLPAGLGFASLSAGVELLFELHRRDVRDEQRAARGLVAERLPHIPLLGWIMYPSRSWKTLRGAVGVRLDLLDPVQTGHQLTTPDTDSRPDKRHAATVRSA